jgi:hypothetical protein
VQAALLKGSIPSSDQTSPAFFGSVIGLLQNLSWPFTS